MLHQYLFVGEPKPAARLTEHRACQHSFSKSLTEHRACQHSFSEKAGGTCSEEPHEESRAAMAAAPAAAAADAAAVLGPRSLEDWEAPRRSRRLCTQ
eukprot:1137446-Pelagomonas_calceolata.AAC.12